MNTEFRKANVREELRSLMIFDRKVFPRSDVFSAGQWRNCKPYWLLIQGRKAGCCAFEEHVDLTDDQTEDQPPSPAVGTLSIATTGILPAYRGKGLGSLMKAWQIAYAKHQGFNRIVTNMRESNLAMRRLNERYGFQPLRVTEHYYADPDEPTVVMELCLPAQRA